MTDSELTAVRPREPRSVSQRPAAEDAVSAARRIYATFYLIRGIHIFAQAACLSSRDKVRPAAGRSSGTTAG